MTEMTMRLPIEIANAIYSFVGKSPTAKIIRQHLKKTEACICDLCLEETDAKYYMPYSGQCDMCYVKENPEATGLGRGCDICLKELHMYKWCKISGQGGGEYCIECYHHLME